MKFPLFVVVTAFASLVAHAADNEAAVAALSKALSCDVALGKMQSVVKAAKALGATPGKMEHEYILVSPISIFGLPVTKIAITPADEGPETYAAIFVGEKSKLNEIASAAQLKPLAGSFVRNTSKGSLSAGVFDRNDVWLTCTPTSKK